MELKTIELETSEGRKDFIIQKLTGTQSGRAYLWLAKRLAKAKSSGGDLFSALEPEDFDYMVQTFLKPCVVDGSTSVSATVFDRLFTGCVDQGFVLITEAIGHNFNSFSKGATAAL